MIVGVDYSTHGIDIVGLALEQNTAAWRHIDFPGAGALARARGVRDALPSRGSWEDNGVVLIAIELPMHRSHQALVPLLRTLGAIHSCLPPQIEVWELSPPEWRYELGMKRMPKRDVGKAEAAAFAAEHWSDMPTLVTQDAIDGFCVAFAARRMCERAVAA